MSSIEDVKFQLWQLLAGDQLRVTPVDVLRQLRAKLPGASATLIRKAIQQMVDAGELLYTQPSGVTHLQLGGVGVVRLGMSS